MKQPSNSGNPIWTNFENRVLRVFRRALELLSEEDDLDVAEAELNRRLRIFIRRANAELGEKHEGLESPIISEANNQPDANDEYRASREDKRPDFQCGLVDRSEKDPLRQDKFYVIECKRIGDPVRKSWVFNENYVNLRVPSSCEVYHDRWLMRPLLLPLPFGGPCFVG